MDRVAQARDEFRKFRRDVAAACVAHSILWTPLLLLVQPGSGIRPMIELPASVFLALYALVKGARAGLPRALRSDERRIGIRYLALAMIPLGFLILTECFMHLVLGVAYEQ